jgi:FAD synthetase
MEISKKIVLVGGCFDILHFGHISFLNTAKSYGDTLIVLLESDENVKKMKGPSRPIHSQTQRKVMLESLCSVDTVISLPPLSGDNAYMEFVQKIHPSVIAITEGDTFTTQKQQQAHSIKAKLVVIPKVHTPSTSQLAMLIGLE